MALDQNLNRLQTFREVVLAGSFSKAAEILKQPKSRVSRNIAQLEKHLGRQLIYRTTRQFQLTQAGLDLFEKAAPLINELGQTLEKMLNTSGEISGVIRISVPVDIGSVLIGKICREFNLLYPKVRVVTLVTNEYVDLVKESIDIALRIGRTKDSTMIQKRIGAIGLIFVVSPELLNRYGALQKIEDLEKLPYLAFSSQDMKRYQVKVSNAKETRSLKFTPTFVSNNFFALRSMAIEGGGLTLLPAFLVRDSIRSGELVQIYKDWNTDPSPIHILIPHQKETPQLIRVFNNFLASSLVQLL